jgi:hypothetical protein
LRQSKKDARLSGIILNKKPPGGAAAFGVGILPEKPFNLPERARVNALNVDVHLVNPVVAAAN